MAFLHGFRPYVVVLLLTFLGRLAAAKIDMTYCASFNTASNGNQTGNFDIYQSDGLCFDFCKADFSFAIIQGKECWCSDYEPASAAKVDVSKCSNPCPGYPDDTCGGDGLWGYMRLNKKPVGTKGPSNAPSTTGTSAAAVTPYTSVAIVTEGGTTREKTVTVTPTNVPANSGNDLSSSQSGLSTGQAVGVAVGVLGFFIILGAVGVFFWMRRRKRAREAEIPSHQNSLRGSSAGMMSTPKTEMASVWDGDVSSAGRRNSRLMPHDPRMDPYSANIYNRFENKSHESVNTLQDNHDYSRRVLRTTNPDPSDTGA